MVGTWKHRDTLQIYERLFASGFSVSMTQLAQAEISDQIKCFVRILTSFLFSYPRNLFSCLFKEIIDNEHWNSCILLGAPKVTTKSDNFCHDSNVISQTFHLNDEYQFRTKFCFCMSKFLFFLKNNFAWHAWLMRKLDHGWYYTKLGKKLTAFIPVILSRKLELKNFCSFNRYLA